jgi:pimeloyl-ACP methyl ester carboxylesterase
LERSAPIDGFSLAFDRFGSDASDPAVVPLHGWPGDRQDWRAVVPLLQAEGRATVVVPDLRGFGDSDRHPADPPEAYAADPTEAYAAAGQAASVLGLLRSLPDAGQVSPLEAPREFAAAIVAALGGAR